MEEKKEKVKIGRPKKASSAHRVKHTTSINENLLKWVKHHAIEEGVTTADIIENAVSYYRTHLANYLNIEK